MEERSITTEKFYKTDVGGSYIYTPLKRWHETLMGHTLATVRMRVRMMRMMMIVVMKKS